MYKKTVEVTEHRNYCSFQNSCVQKFYNCSVSVTISNTHFNLVELTRNGTVQSEHRADQTICNVGLLGET